jgi:hypothetical protein
MLPVNSSLSTVLQTFDVQILMCDWAQAWNLLLPNAVNIVLGMNNDPPTAKMIANCYKKAHFRELSSGDQGEVISYIPDDSQFKRLPIEEQKFKFIYPESFKRLDKSMLDAWFTGTESHIDFEGNKKVKNIVGCRFVVYYPEPYCNPEALADAIVASGYGNLDIDIVASPERLESIRAMMYHPNKCDSFMGHNLFKIHRIKHSAETADLKTWLERITYERYNHF